MSEGNSEQTQILKEILKWIRFSGMNQVKIILTSELQTDEDKIVYQKSDGTRGTVELAKLVGVSNKTIDRMWDKWLKMGLGESIPVKGGQRFKKSFDLEEFGIKLPDRKETATAVNPKPEEKQV